jgi:hypothetical protein
MVFRQLKWFVIGVGMASLPMHALMHQTVKEEQADLTEEFRRQRDLIFHLKLKELTVAKKPPAASQL